MPFTPAEIAALAASAIALIALAVIVTCILDRNALVVRDPRDPPDAEDRTTTEQP